MKFQSDAEVLVIDGMRFLASQPHPDVLRIFGEEGISWVKNLVDTGRLVPVGDDACYQLVQFIRALIIVRDERPYVDVEFIAHSER